MSKDMCFTSYLKCVDDKMLSKTRRRMNKKSHKKRHYGGAEAPAADGAGVGESVSLEEMLSGILSGTFSASQLGNVQLTQNKWEGEENEESAQGTKIQSARTLFTALRNRPDMTRQDIIDAFMQRIGVTQSTAVSYYERIAKEFGLTNQEKETYTSQDANNNQFEEPGQNSQAGGPDAFGGGDPTAGPVEELPADTDLALDDEVDPEQWDDPNRQGVIRTVDNSHLIYKRQTPEGTFDELWIYNIKPYKLADELDVRRAILAGTDIEPNKTKSEDGTQSYTLTTLGNAQYLHVMGLPN